VFLTTAVNVGGDFKEPSTGIYGNDYAADLTAQGLSDDEVMSRVIARDIELRNESGEVRYVVMALSAKSGEVLWEREAHRGKPFGGRHRKNTYASETPVTDGERVYVYFGNVGLFAYSMSGDSLWERRFEPRAIYLDFGTASSPAIDADHVYVLHDNQEDSFLAAVDKRNGEVVWSTARDEGERMIRSGWSTPFVWERERDHDHDSDRTIVAVGLGRAIGYDTKGAEVWRLSGLSGQATPTPIAGLDLLFVGTGSQGESNRPMFAVLPGAKGDISLTRDESTNEFIAWFEPRASAYTSSPLLYDGRLYVVNDNGILSVFDARTGKRAYRARVGGGGHTFSASPWAHAGRVFYLSEDGDTFVTVPGDEYQEEAKNSLDEMSLASPAVSNGMLFIRTQTRLYAIGPGQQQAVPEP
jgi:outer membrane protein assembly factor BamB